MANRPLALAASAGCQWRDIGEPAVGLIALENCRQPVAQYGAGRAVITAVSRLDAAAGASALDARRVRHSAATAGISHAGGCAAQTQRSILGAAFGGGGEHCPAPFFAGAVPH